MMSWPKALCTLLAALGLIAGGSLVFRGARPSPSREDRGPSLRVVSLAPSVTEMLFSLGVGDAVVGVTDYCDYPPEAKRIECVGGFGQPNVEKLLAVAPDVVIAAGLEHPKVAQTLRGAGIRVLDVRIRSIDEMWQGLRQIGQAVGRPQRAEELIAAMQAELAAVSVRHRGTPQAQRPRVFVEIGDHPLTTAGGSSYLDDVIARAGGCNVAHDVAQAYFHVSPEQVIAWNPDFILTARMGQTEDPTAGFSRRIGWGEMSAVKRGAIIHDIPADYLFRPGPRLIEGVKALAQRLQQAPHTTEERPALARGSTSQDRSPLTPTPLPGVPGRGANSTSGISPCP